MIRRKFLTTSIASTSVPFAFAATSRPSEQQDQSKALFEMRTYEIRFGGNQSRLKDYLKNVYQPALLASGANQMMLFNEWGQSDPAKLWALISYPDAATYLQCQQLGSDASFQQASSEYDAIGPEDKIYNRYSSSLLLAFDGMPAMAESTDGSGLFELRTYEGYSEDAVRRKIGMFNKEEIDLFLKVKLNPVFFGEMIVGPYRPSLVYMLHFKDMEERNANWDVFRQHPDW
ncbi:MAG: NIPSNAP family protein, partial [Bacteroidota bacterium]